MSFANKQISKSQGKIALNTFGIKRSISEEGEGGGTGSYSHALIEKSESVFHNTESSGENFEFGGSHISAGW